MEYRRLGHSGLKISALSFGSWVTFATQVDAKLALRLMQIAYDAGVNFFDNAEAYAHGQSEIIMGDVLRKTGWTRDSYCISSKVFWGGQLPTQLGLSKKHIVDACHAALKRLQVDYLDLYFCHRPDIETPIEETVWTMHNLITQGKILYWGTSEWATEQIMQAYAVARQYNLTPPTMEQPEYNLFHRDKVEYDFVRLYKEIGLGLTTWSPLASGLLTGKYNNGIPADSRANLPGYAWLRRQFESDAGHIKIEKTKQLAVIAKNLGIELSQLALTWCLSNRNVSTVILGATKVEQLENNLKAIDKLNLLTPDVLMQIENIVQSKPPELISYK